MDAQSQRSVIGAEEAQGGPHDATAKAPSTEVHEESVPRAPTARRMRIPARHNANLSRVVERMNDDLHLQQLWKCANVTAVNRLKMTDHGPVHIRIVVNIALRLLRLLGDAKVEFGIVRDYDMRPEDAEVVVVLAAAMHDLGMSIHRSNHEQYSLILAAPKVRELITDIYDEPERTIIASEILHAIISHRSDMRGLTAEAGCVKVADALDMAEGRSRIPFQAGKIDVHSLSAAAIDSVTIGKGEHRPIGITVAMNNSAGIFQLDELLKPKIVSSGIAEHIEVTATIAGETERRLLPVYHF
ncbi:MAG TPA: HD domain-containing protein [Chloroflexota bacterium]|nr:HD domain-containing protein [Chloroflexota bacterium]